MIILKSITTNGICFTLCRTVGVLMEKFQSVLFSAIFKCKQVISLISWSLMMFCVVTRTGRALTQAITVALAQSQVAGLLSGLVPFYFYFNLSRVVESECHIYIYHNSSENVSKNDLVACCVIIFLIPMLLCELTCLKKKKKPIVWMCVILPYSTVGIWGVEVMLPDYAANW